MSKSWHDDYWSDHQPDEEDWPHEARWTWRGWFRVAEHLLVCLAMIWSGIIWLAVYGSRMGYVMLGIAAIAFVAAVATPKH